MELATEEYGLAREILLSWTKKNKEKKLLNWSNSNFLFKFEKKKQGLQIKIENKNRNLINLTKNNQ